MFKNIIRAFLMLLLFLALWSHQLADPGSVLNSNAGHVQNWIGWVGASISDVLFHGFGLMAYLFIFLFVPFKGFTERLKIIFYLCLALNPMFALYVPSTWSQGQPGGWFGSLLGWQMVHALGEIGSILFALMIVIYVLLEQIWALEDVSKMSPPSVAAEVKTKAPHEALLQRIKKKEPPLKKSLIEPTITPGGYRLPLELLHASSTQQAKLLSPAQETQLKELLEARMADFGIEARVVHILQGPVVTRLELMLAAGTKASRLTNIARDLARSLSLASVRVIEVIPGKDCVGLEIPNTHRQTVFLYDLIKVLPKNAMPLTLVLGQDIAGAPVLAELTKMPHLLVAGTTGSGKSVGIHSLLLSLMFQTSFEDLRLILIDPKMLELAVYEGIPHLLAPVVTDMNDAAGALRWAVAEMDRRYRVMAALGVRNLHGYNEKVKQLQAKGETLASACVLDAQRELLEAMETKTMPYIVIVADEFADMMMVVGKKVEQLIARLAQKARAAGIHLILATQRPSVDVITGLIKANIPTRIAFQVSSKIDSRTILDQQGAESLLGHGDMLYLPPGAAQPIRAHGALVTDDEVHRVVAHLKTLGTPEYLSLSAEENVRATLDEGEASSDGLLEEAIDFIKTSKRVSISSLQRQFRIGYNRAATLMEKMEAMGKVSEPDKQGQRQWLDRD